MSRARSPWLLRIPLATAGTPTGLDRREKLALLFPDAGRVGGSGSDCVRTQPFCNFCVKRRDKRLHKSVQLPVTAVQSVLAPVVETTAAVSAVKSSHSGASRTSSCPEPRHDSPTGQFSARRRATTKHIHVGAVR